MSSQKEMHEPINPNTSTQIWYHMELIGINFRSAIGHGEQQPAITDSGNTGFSLSVTSVHIIIPVGL